MRKIVFPLVLLASAFVQPLAAHADAIDDFVLTGVGNSNIITFSLPASPPGNEMTCPPISPSCVPGSQTAFYASALVTTNGVSSVEFLAFPTFRFGGGLSLGLNPGRLFGQQLFAPDAANPTFLTGTFDLGGIGFNGPPPAYVLTITPETTAPTPEPSTLALFGTGLAGLIEFARTRKRRV